MIRHSYTPNIVDMSVLPSDLKPLYLKWLDELISNVSSRQEQLQITYSKARRNLEETQEIFYYPNDLKKVKGIGNTIIKRLEEKLIEYCKELNVDPPTTIASNNKNNDKERDTTRVRTIEKTNSTDEPAKKKRKYIPRKRSGAYGILLGLLELKAIDRGVFKDGIIESSQKYTDSSMTPNHTTKEFYGAWAAIGLLKKHCLILEEGRPKRYSLTESGAEMANTLKIADNIIFSYENDPNRKDLCNYYNDEPEITADLSELINDGKIDNDKSSIFENSSFMDTTFPKISNIERFSSPVKSHLSRDIAENDENFEKYTDSIIRRRFVNISYELWKKNSYEIYPIIDHREIKSKSDREFFSNALSRKGINSEIQQLSLGDILWVAKNKNTGTICVLNTIIERKRLDDLAISIRDNRFMEQKNRLEKSGCSNIYYLIEETMSSGSIGNMSEALKTALWVISVYYKFSLIRTLNSENTVEKLHALHTVISQEYSKKDLIVLLPKEVKNQHEYKTLLQNFKIQFNRNGNIDCCHTFECFQDVMSKNDLRNVGELTIQILLYIRGVSLEKAIAIQAIWPTLNHILKAYRNCKTEIEAKHLMFAKLGNAPGNKRITKNLSEKIADVLSPL